jgi:hypothetical protein
MNKGLAKKTADKKIIEIKRMIKEIEQSNLNQDIKDKAIKGLCNR